MCGKQWKLKTVNKVFLLDVDQIRPNPAQPRKEFNQEELKSLAESIVANGLLHPLTVRKCDSGYELISGERRLRALKYANLKEAPCILLTASDRQAAVLALLENIQREDLNYFEEALALKNLIVEWGLSQNELGARLGKSQPTIANKLRLLKFSPEEQQWILDHHINERQARALLKLEEPGRLMEVVEYIEEQHLNASQTEDYIGSLSAHPQEPPRQQKFCPIVKDVRLFFNTINKAIHVMNQSGIGASAERLEKGDHIEYIVRIPLTTAR